MLVTDEVRMRARQDDDRGAALITVLIVMLVGFVVASIVAASVLYTVQANAANRGRTQAFVAAESGRDVAVAAVAAGCSITDFSGSDPEYSSTVYVTNGNQPASSTDAGVSEGCPTSSTRYVVIRSTGVGADGSVSTIDSVYPWQVTYSEQPGGVVTYFSGGYTAGVSHYTGDLVVRDGPFACNIDGTLTGDLYVLDGTTSFSNNCTVNGDIWSNGNVSNTSQAVTINGDITTNGFASLTANGNTRVDGFINAKGDITLSNQGSSAAEVTGNLTSRNAINVGSDWTVGGTQTPNSPTDPVFEPTLAWLKAATKWIDLDNTGWGTKYTATNVCNSIKNNPNPTLNSLVSVAGPPLVLDFTSCNGAVDIALSGITVRRDVVMIGKPTERMNVNVSGSMNDDGNKRQVLFVHSDATRNYTNGEPVPNCGNGNQKDTFNIGGTIDQDLRFMMYTPCGITGTATSSFSGQYYTNDTSTHSHSGATYTCKAMAWSPAFDELGCKIKGSGGIAEGSLVQRMGGLVYQTEL